MRRVERSLVRVRKRRRGVRLGGNEKSGEKLSEGKKEKERSEGGRI
jgi:hypothetical protein